MSKNVLIAGATGDTGRAAVRESLALGLNVRAMVRKQDARSDALKAQGAEIVIGDLNDINSIRSAMQGMDAGYFVWPVADGLITATVNFAQAANEAGLKYIVNLSQRSADRESTSNSCRDTYISEQVFNWSGVPVIHLRPTYFLEWLLYPWSLPYLQAGVLRIPAGKGRHSPIAADDQGRAIASLLKDPRDYLGQIVPLSGPVEMDHEQMARELSEALGRPIVYQDLPIAEYIDSLGQMGVPQYVLQHFTGAMADYQHGHMSGADNNVELITGKRSMTVGEFARLHADRLNGK
ncbi:Uncharacterized conserved protein YbjT, contains NAD(P)-binding and DUF2867 domains [Luteibacter sp. UNCMF331Sha3.1]|uniref:NmrA family NAD(P)-binding protein n=1 Tax=Luteibacter sp. UNCMF331Sha3.1 TaxID=1502760 RepID=UPI0008B0527F|nr:NmrA family NAD(P)-binding protein [Luteibacter sp. UNCMF331Sha3.1]SEN10698.1 Uncharacterized conserved protein YbjT, contains NAD(P)-binding and DUF2867 domains [Luteibacter sp. UNCMF331Sha3.1]